MNKNNNQNNNTKEYKLYVEGMHCASCEILIEKKLLKHDGIKSIDASLKDSSVSMIIERGTDMDINKLNEDFKDLGYKFSTAMIQNKPKLLWHKDSQGKIVINKDKVYSLGKTILVVLGLLLVFFIFEKMQLGRYVSVDSRSSLPAFFLLGLVAGVSSCAALIGGLLLSMIKHWHEVYIDSADSSQKSKPHILFHTGRLLSFFILDGLLGLLGDFVSFSNTTVYAGLVIVISLVMFLLALQMLGVSWANKFSLRLPKFITRFAADEKTFQGKYMPFVTGAATFFLPCGFTLIAQGIALTTGSFLLGGMIMFFFALGTLPMLIGISITGLKFTSKPHLTARFSSIAGLLIIFFVIYNINGQLNVLGYSSLSDIKFTQSEIVNNTGQADDDVFVFYRSSDAKPFDNKSGSANTVVVAAGEQVVNLIAQGFSYIPNSPTTITAGVPTKLVVDNQGILGCGAFITARGLFNGFVSLESGTNIIDLGSPKKGKYKVTCSMGMVPPVTITVE